MSFPMSVKICRSECTPLPTKFWGGDGRADPPRACWGRLLLGAVGLVVALGAAAPSRRTSPSPGATMYQDTLNGVQVTLTIPASQPRGFYISVRIHPYGLTVLDAPSSLTVTVSAVTRSNDRKQAHITLSSSGTFSNDWNLSVRVSNQRIIGEATDITTSNTLSGQAQNQPTPVNSGGPDVPGVDGGGCHPGERPRTPSG